jgi:hypothetical protein
MGSHGLYHPESAIGDVSHTHLTLVFNGLPGIFSFHIIERLAMAKVETIVFLSLLLDLFAFTIPLPLFPRIIEWYNSVSADRISLTMDRFADAECYSEKLQTLQASCPRLLAWFDTSAVSYTTSPVPNRKDGTLCC